MKIGEPVSVRRQPGREALDRRVVADEQNRAEISGYLAQHLDQITGVGRVQARLGPVRGVLGQAAGDAVVGLLGGESRGDERRRGRDATLP